MNKIDKIKNSIDIVEIIQEYVELTKKGKNYWGICPFHDDSNPSMSVSPEKQLYKCFSCDNGGGVFKFVQQIDKVSFKEAVNIVGKKIGIQIDIKDNIKKYNKNQEKIIKVLNDAMDFYIISIETKEGHHALEYAKKRNLDAKIREKFKIGYAPKNNNLTKFLTNKKKYDIALLMNASLTTSKENDFLNDKLIFGIQNEYGDIIALSGRTLYNDEPKYMNSAETNVFKKNNVLYNWYNAKFTAKKNKELIIVEGFMDVIAIYKAGIENVVAIMGTTLTKENISKFHNISITLMLDNDNAGKRATIKSIKLLLENKIKCFVVNNKNIKDPDEILKNEGKEILLKNINNKITALEYIYKIHKQKYNSKNFIEIEKMIKSFKKYLVYANNIEKDYFANLISNQYKISKEIILQDIGKLKNKENKIINYSIKNFEKNKLKKIKNKININKHIFILIKSLIKSKNMCLEYEKKYSKINISNLKFKNICRSIQYAKLNGKKINKKYKNQIIEIEKNSQIQIVNNIEDFDNLINNINNTYKIINKNKYKSKF